jgi:hypothetical protein
VPCSAPPTSSLGGLRQRRRSPPFLPGPERTRAKRTALARARSSNRKTQATPHLAPSEPVLSATDIAADAPDRQSTVQRVAGGGGKGVRPETFSRLSLSELGNVARVGV